MVSILMSAFNSESLIAKAIESVLVQTYKDFEFIIVDDGSDDNTLTVINYYAAKDDRIRVLTQSNQGMGAALNNALGIAKYDLIVRMDSDDIMLPYRIERQVEFMQSHPNVAVASCLVYYINEEDVIIGRSSSDLRSKADFKRYLKKGKLIGVSHPGVVMRKSVVMEVGGYRPQFWPADDIDLWMRIAEQGHVILVQQEHLLKYRIHGSSVSVAGAKEARLKVDWVKECIKARGSRNREPSWEEFLELRAKRSVFQRVNKERKDLAKVLYKVGVHKYARNELARALFALGGCLLLQPDYLLGQIRAKHAMRS